MPLVFGTLKATFYSLLFCVPLALLAALYTSEFLHRASRARVKPTIEMMASLPSVVLGFLAALVLAPFVEGVVPAVLLAFVAVPVDVPRSARYLWQLLPQHARDAPRRAGRASLAIACLLPVGICVAAQLGPAFERAVLRAATSRCWLDGQIRGDAPAAGRCSCLPLSAIAVAGPRSAACVNPRLLARRRSAGAARRSALADLVQVRRGRRR